MKLAALEIKNFGCIGEEGITIHIDNIVVLIGANNSGKSTVLKAYEAFSGTGEPLEETWFHRERKNVPVEIIGTFVEISNEDIEKIKTTKWIYDDTEFGKCIRVKWQWNSPGSKGQKYSWDNSIGDWKEGGMGGFDSLISSCVPTPLTIRPTDSSKDIESKILEILTSAVKEKVKNDSTKVDGLINEFIKIAEEVQKEIATTIEETFDNLKDKLDKVFPDHEILIKPSAGKIEPEKVIGAGSHVRIKDPLGESYPLSQQGTGLQRTFIWTAIGALAEIGRYKQGKKTISPEEPRILLVEEPEVFLHPPAIRAAREALYSLAEVSGWQVMVTTHSPIFIDVSKPHTTIIRVERDASKGSKIFSTEKAQFDGDERDRLRMIRSCHPTVNEFFFADHVILVEGETEHAVLNSLLASNQNPNLNIHVVNCMGKANIPLFVKILNHFGTTYTILHDSDSPKVRRDGNWVTNSMWTINKRIAEVVSERDKNLPSCFSITHIPDFEQYYFGYLQKGDKPFHAIKIIHQDDFETNPQFEKLRLLLKNIIEHNHPYQYSSYEELCNFVLEWVENNNPEEPEKWEIE
ncbi:ATP-dependent nuclease [Zhaonella formicivorans]|uniref:ATP-dependent nuclease n=1 Tax=Zhaonella formicivorans TaxID=2528593 RepID=UPI0010DB8F80|nr:AAA family ATPase [Zhaonella formicivorans]